MAILDHAVGDLELELRAPYGRVPLRPYASVADAVSDLELGVDANGLGGSRQIALWAPRLGPEPRDRLRKDELGGWGVIYVFFGGVHARTITESWLTHNSEKRAHKWEDAYLRRFGPVSAWDWAELERVSRKLRYHISRRLAVGKTKPPLVHYVLEHAHESLQRGFTAIDGGRRPVDYP